LSRLCSGHEEDEGKEFERPVDAGRTLVAALRGFELDRLARAEQSFAEFRRRLEVLLHALLPARPKVYNRPRSYRARRRPGKSAVPADGYLAGVKALCERYGSLYIADEVQTGLGRTGHLWGVQAWGIEPDILVTGKGLSGGLYPMAAIVMTPKIGAWLSDQGWGYVSTFGGAELGCRVASRVLDICSRADVLAGVRRTAARVAAGLAELRARHSFLVGVRQKGVVIGLETAADLGGMQLSRALYRRGVWAMFSGFAPSVLQFKVGLLVDDAYCDLLLERLDAALGDVEKEIG